MPVNTKDFAAHVIQQIREGTPSHLALQTTCLDAGVHDRSRIYLLDFFNKKCSASHRPSQDEFRDIFDWRLLDTDTKIKIRLERMSSFLSAENEEALQDILNDTVMAESHVA